MALYLTNLNISAHRPVYNPRLCQSRSLSASGAVYTRMKFLLNLFYSLASLYSTPSQQIRLCGPHCLDLLVPYGPRCYHLSYFARHIYLSPLRIRVKDYDFFYIYTSVDILTTAA